MPIDSVQPYNKRIIDLACSVCVKYQTKKPRSDISYYRPHARSISLLNLLLVQSKRLRGKNNEAELLTTDTG